METLIYFIFSYFQTCLDELICRAYKRKKILYSIIYKLKIIYVQIENKLHKFESPCIPWLLHINSS